MDKFLHDMFGRTVKSFIEDQVFRLFLKLGNWLEARVPSVAARVVLGFLLSAAAIGSVVIVTALAGV